MRRYKCRVCRSMFQAGDRGRLPRSCPDHRRESTNARRRERHRLGPVQRPECCCNTVCPQHGSMHQVRQEYDWKPQALGADELDQVNSMLSRKSGSVLDRPHRNGRTTPSGADEGMSAWFPAIFPEWAERNAEGRLRAAVAAGHSWWTPERLKALEEPSWLPDGRWYLYLGEYGMQSVEPQYRMWQNVN